MPSFDVKTPLWILPAQAEDLIEDAWIGQVAGTGLISELICAMTQSVHLEASGVDDFDWCIEAS